MMSIAKKKFLQANNWKIGTRQLGLYAPSGFKNSRWADQAGRKQGDTQWILFGYLWNDYSIAAYHYHEEYLSHNVSSFNPDVSSWTTVFNYSGTMVGFDINEERSTPKRIFVGTVNASERSIRIQYLINF